MSQLPHDLLHDCVRPGLDLLLRLILDRMRYEDGLQIGAAQSTRLDTGRRPELLRSDRDGRDPELLDANAVVQTARCTGASIG